MVYGPACRKDGRWRGGHGASSAATSRTYPRRKSLWSRVAIDQYGDLGDREKLTSVYADFAAAVVDIEAAYAAR